VGDKRKGRSSQDKEEIRKGVAENCKNDALYALKLRVDPSNPQHRQSCDPYLEPRLEKVFLAQPRWGRYR
jgi:hypothetical protein